MSAGKVAATRCALRMVLEGLEDLDPHLRHAEEVSPKVLTAILACTAMLDEVLRLNGSPHLVATAARELIVELLTNPEAVAPKLLADMEGR